LGLVIASMSIAGRTRCEDLRRHCISGRLNPDRSPSPSEGRGAGVRAALRAADSPPILGWEHRIQPRSKNRAKIAPCDPLTQRTYGCRLRARQTRVGPRTGSADGADADRGTRASAQLVGVLLFQRFLESLSAFINSSSSTIFGGGALRSWPKSQPSH